MNLLEICTVLAKDVGQPIPEQIIGSPVRTWIEAREFANRVGREMMRRVDWGDLVKSTTLTGTGTSAALSLPTDFERLGRGVCVTANGAIVRPLTRPEWNTLAPVVGVPRYFVLEKDTLSFWPFLASGATATVSYISNLWVEPFGYIAPGLPAAPGRPTEYINEFATDLDEPRFPSDVFTQGLIYHWRRQKGMDYADYEASYEAALRDHAAFDDRARF